MRPIVCSRAIGSACPRSGPRARPATQAAGPAEPRLSRHVLLEDDALLVIDKPAGVAAHGGSGISRGVIEQLRAGAAGAAIPRAGSSARSRHLRSAAAGEETQRVDRTARADPRRQHEEVLPGAGAQAAGATTSSMSACRSTKYLTADGRAASQRDR